MSKEVQFTMKLEPELRDQFMAEAEAAHRPASQVVRELMREFVQRQRQTREYDEFLQRKVDTARASMRSGRGRSNDEVDAAAVARRAKVTVKACIEEASPLRTSRDNSASNYAGSSLRCIHVRGTSLQCTQPCVECAARLQLRSL